MFNAFESALIKYKRPYILLKGDKKTRFETAVKKIDEILTLKTNLQSFSDNLIDIDLHFLHQQTNDFKSTE